MSFPLTLNSMGASAAFSNWITEPTASWRTSRMGNWQLPSSMVKLTGTSRTRLRLAGCSAIALIKSLRGDRVSQLDGPFAAAHTRLAEKFRDVAETEFHLGGALRAKHEDVSKLEPGDVGGGNFETVPLRARADLDVIELAVPGQPGGPGGSRVGLRQRRRQLAHQRLNGSVGKAHLN